MLPVGELQINQKHPVFLSMNHGGSSYHRNDDVLHLVDEDTSCLLCLLEFERLHLHAEQVSLRILPFPSSALFTILQLDFLHGSDKLVGLVVVDGLLLKQFVIKHLSSLQEQGHPCAIEDASQQEDGKYQLVVAAIAPEPKRKRLVAHCHNQQINGKTFREVSFLQYLCTEIQQTLT